MKKIDEIKALTGLRGVGALWVFLYHLLPSFKINIISQGNLAVPLFFVLSGFIMLCVHKDDFQEIPQSKTLIDFFSSRFARIFPLHIFVLLVLFMVVAFLPFFTDRYAQGAFSLPNFFASILLIQTWGLGHLETFRSASASWNVPAWSISAELLYYILFPWIAYALINGGKRGWSFFQVIFCAGLALASYGLLITDEFSYTRNLICGVFAFSLGMAMVVWKNEINNISTKVFELMAAIFIITNLIFPHANIGLFVIGSAFLILSLTRADSFAARTCESRFIYFLGKISFSVYLIHWPIIQILNYIQSFNIFSEPLENLVSRLAVIPFVFLLSYYSFLKIEIPFRTILRKRLKKNASAI